MAKMLKDISVSVSINFDEDHITKAKMIAMSHFNVMEKQEGADDLTLDDMNVVWFSKTLSNWKALVSAPAFTRLYYEVTYSGSKAEAYLDCYIKKSNMVFPDHKPNTTRSSNT